MALFTMQRSFKKNLFKKFLQIWLQDFSLRVPGYRVDKFQATSNLLILIDPLVDELDELVLGKARAFFLDHDGCHQLLDSGVRQSEHS